MIYPLSTPQLEYLILSVLCKRDSYGYEISQQLKTVTNTKDSTLYPILKRLQGNGLVVTYDQQYQGRNRRYYQITPEGRGICQYLENEWRLYVNAIYEIAHGVLQTKVNRKNEKSPAKFTRPKKSITKQAGEKTHRQPG